MSKASSTPTAMDPRDVSRLLAISDGIFAVALTLLILDVKPPAVNETQLASAILATAPRLGIFGLSFAIVAYWWVAHHDTFTYVHASDRGLLWLNMLFLVTIAVLPYSAAVLADHPLAAPAIALYGVNVVNCSATLSIVGWYAFARKLSVDLPRLERRHLALAIRSAISPMLALFGVAVSSVAPAVSLSLFVAIPVILGSAAGIVRKSRPDRPHSR